MTEILPGSSNNTQNIVIASDKLPPAAWQAIYYHLSKKTETNRKLYTGAFEITKPNIVDLVHKLEQSIVPYSPTAQKVEFSISFRNDSSEQLSDISKFSNIDLSHKNSATSSVAIDFDFIICPGVEYKLQNNIPQKFKVFILLDQDFFLDDSEGTNFFDDGVAGKNILTVIEYSDYVISRNIRTAIEEWVHLLPKREPSYLSKFIPKAIKWTRGSLPYICSALSLLPLLKLLTQSKVETHTSIILISLITALALIGLTKFFLSWSMDTIAKIQPTTYLLITSGDESRRVDLEKKMSSLSRFFVFIFTSAIVSFAIGTGSSIFASWISR